MNHPEFFASRALRKIRGDSCLHYVARSAKYPSLLKSFLLTKGVNKQAYAALE
jgi:hypothetical protein